MVKLIDYAIVINVLIGRTRCDTSDNVCRDLQIWRYFFWSVTYNVVKVTQTENVQYDIVSELVCWYWKYHSFKSEKKMPKL